MFTCLLALLAETFPITDLSTVDGCEFLGQMAKWSNPLGASNPLAIKAVGDGSNGVQYQRIHGDVWTWTKVSRTIIRLANIRPVPPIRKKLEIPWRTTE
jgi:hypothetical protein